MEQLQPDELEDTLHYCLRFIIDHRNDTPGSSRSRALQRRSKTSTSTPGSPSNIVKTLNALHSLRRKHHELTVLIVGHANKQGKVAGPLTLQHLVDTVVLLEIDKSNSRILTTLKNRFGPSGIRTSFELQALVQ